MQKCAITIDVDSLKSIFKGKDLQENSNYSYLEYKIGFEQLLKVFERFNIKATFFTVGQDLLFPPNKDIIRDVYYKGHEIASHTMNHTQGFRYLSIQDKIKELELTENIIEETIGKKPIGFRSPGWNIGDDAIDILIKRGYQYDSSVFPTSLAPLLKFLHYISMNSRSGIERTTLGQIDYMFAPVIPYQTHLQRLRKKGKSGFYEFPVSVTPIFRIPFFATFLLSTGLNFFKASYHWIRLYKRPIIFLFHLFDFVDFSHPEFRGQLPEKEGVYIPASVKVPFDIKYNIFYKALELIANDYEFLTLEDMKRAYDSKT